MRHLTLLLVAIVALSAAAQRRINPTDDPKLPQAVLRDTLPPGTPGAMPPHMHDSIGNVIIIDTINNRLDTIAVMPRVAKMRYPLIYNVAVGVDIWDGVFRMFGQKYGIGSVWAELNMHNRYFPFFEVGFSSANDTPDDRNFTYKSPLAPYFKIGAAYNIFYNSNPDYQLKFGLHYGFTSFKYDITDVTVDDGYWDSPSHFSIPTQTATAGYLEIIAAVKVKLWRNLAMGWTVKFHRMMHLTASDYGEPLVIPGFGKRGSTFTGGFSIIYTLPLNKPRPTEVNKKGEQ